MSNDRTRKDEIEAFCKGLYARGDHLSAYLEFLTPDERAELFARLNKESREPEFAWRTMFERVDKGD